MAIAQSVRRWLERHDRWLLIFDNAVDLRDIETLLPRAGGGNVIITSRQPNWPNATCIPVSPLSRDSAADFLQRRTGQRDNESAHRLADALGDLPLALEQSAAYILATGLDIDTYLTLYSAQRRALWREERAPLGYPDTVATAWSMSIAKIRESNPTAIDLLGLCSFLAPDAISRILFAYSDDDGASELSRMLTNPLALNGAIRALRNYSLVDTTPHTLSFHLLVQAATRDTLSDEAKSRLIGEAIRLLNAGFLRATDLSTGTDFATTLISHSMVVTQYLDDHHGDGEAAALLLQRSGKYLFDRAEFGPARICFERALDFANRASNVSANLVASILSNFGILLSDQCEFSKARDCYDRALALIEKVVGPKGPEIGTILSNLGMLFERQANYEIGRRLLEESHGYCDSVRRGRYHAHGHLAE